MDKVVLISLLLLSLEYSDSETECKYAAVGQTKVIDLEYTEWMPVKKLHLQWTDGVNMLYNSKKTTQKYPITSNGSLLLENVQLGNNGTYQASIYNDEGMLLKFTKTSLCVLLPVSKPGVTLNCGGPNFQLRCDVGKSVSVKIVWSLNGKELLEHKSTTLKLAKLKPEDRYACTASNPVSKEKSDDIKPICTEPVSKPSVKYTCNGTTVVLTCEVGNSAGVNVMWSHNGKPLTGNTHTTMNVVKATLKPGDRYACTASNKASEKKSDEVNPDCKELFGMELWLMVLILVSGGGLLLILIMIILVCVCWSRRQRKRHLEEEELRLTPLTQPTRQCSLHHPPQNPQTHPQNKAPSRAKPNRGPQARPRPQQPLPDNAQPIPTPRGTGPRKHKR